MKYLASIAFSAAMITGVASLAQAETASNHDAAALSHMSATMDALRHSKNVGGPLAPELRNHPVVAMVRAEWCSACKQVKPVLDPLLHSYGSNVHVVMFDVTDAKAAAQSEAKAKKLGLEKFFAGARSSTSTVAVINPKTGDIAGQFYDDTESKDYKEAIHQVQSELAHK